MPDAIITSTASTFGTISGTFAADQSTITGTVAGSVVGTLTGSVGVPGPVGPAGPGSTWGGIVGTLSDQTDLQSALDAKQNVSGMSAYLTKAGNLSGLTDLATARDNLGLGSLSTPTFAGVNVPGSGTSVANLGATFLTINQQGSGQFTIQPSQGIVFPDATVQTTAFTGAASTAWGSITGTLSSQTDLQTALNLKAPLASPVFTGDARAVTPTFGDNDTSIATTAFVQSALLGGTAIARNLEVEVRNQSGVTVPAGSIVYISGATGNKPLITLAQANNDANSAQTIGFVKTAIANNGTGYVIVRGELENIDTSALAEGVQLYLSTTTAGTWTTTKPSAPQHLVYVGIVIRSHPTLGTILVAVQNGYELDELHDVAIASKANNDLLAYESSTNLWKNKSFGTLGLLTSSSLTGYATESWVTAGFYPLTGNPSGFITSSALSPYLTSATAASTYAALAGATFTGEVITPASTTSNAGLTITPGVAPTTPTNGEIWATTNDLQVRLNGTTETIAEQSWVSANYLTTSGAVASYARIDGVIFTGLVSTLSPTTATAGLRLPHGTAPTSPVNGDVWTTTSGLFMRQNGSTQQYVDFGGTQTISGAKTFSNANLSFGTSTAAGTINLGTGATVSGSTKTVNVGSGAVTGSTTFVNIGSNSGTSTTTLQGVTNSVTPALDSNTVQVATTQFVVGQAGSATPLVNGTAAVGTSLRYARQDHVHGTDTTRAPLASPSFTGVPLAPTATLGTNTTQIATTAFVQSAVSAGAGAVWGSITGTLSSQTDLQSALNAKLDSTTAASTYQTIAGMSSYLTTASAASTYAPLASPALTGVPTAPTAANGTNTTQVATTAFVLANGGAVTSVAGRTGAVTLAVADVSGAAPLASPALTGTPNSTTAAVDTNTTQIATTAYVVGQGYLKSATASTTYAPLASPALTGTPTAPTATAGASTTQLATTAFVTTADNLKANLASPALTGTPTAPTATAGTNTTQIATTAYVRADNNVKAWVNFNGTGTVAIRASFNVSSITDNGTGDYTVNMTTAMVDTNYSVFATAVPGSTNEWRIPIVHAKSTVNYTESPTTSTFRIIWAVNTVTVPNTDIPICQVCVIR